MASPNNPAEDERELVRQAQGGAVEALTTLRERHQAALLNILLARGASQTEAQDVLADLWSDCVPGASGKPGLLAKFEGKYSLLSWLARVAGNRWIDLKRRGAKYVAAAEADFDDLPGCATALEEDGLLSLLRECLRAAFAGCSSEALVLLRLVYVHGLSQREVGRMVGWSEAKTSRALARAMEQIKTCTLRELTRRDARLELTWADFVGLCAAETPDFL